MEKLIYHLSSQNFSDRLYPDQDFIIAKGSTIDWPETQLIFPLGNTFCFTFQSFVNRSYQGPREERSLSKNGWLLPSKLEYTVAVSENIKHSMHFYNTFLVPIRIKDSTAIKLLISNLWFIINNIPACNSS